MLLSVPPAWALDSGGKFLPLGNTRGSMHDLRAGAAQAKFIPLASVKRRESETAMMPLRGGASGETRVWKLKDLRDTPERPKSQRVPADVRLAMATSHLPDTRAEDASSPTRALGREEIAAALAPVFAGDTAEADAAALETDIALPRAVASGMTETADVAQRQRQGQGQAYVWPVAEEHIRISSPFGPRRHPVTGQRDFHAGIDIPAPQGTRVLAAADGEVTGVGEHPNLGRYVKVTHADGSYSLYGHLQRWTTRMGHRVRAGDIIGRVGSTGRSTGPHLDFSLRRDGKPFNPMQVLAEVLQEKKLAMAE